MKSLKYIIATLFLSFVLLSAQAQKRFIYLDDDTHTYDYYDYLVNSGKYVPDYVLYQPYVMQADSQNADKSSADRYYTEYWRHYYGDNKNLSLSINVDAGMKGFLLSP